MRVVFRCDPAIENELMRPIAARAALPDWLRGMPRTAFSEPAWTAPGDIAIVSSDGICAAHRSPAGTFRSVSHRLIVALVVAAYATWRTSYWMVWHGWVGRRGCRSFRVVQAVVGRWRRDGALAPALRTCS